jgi:hypothetical protein
MRNRVEIPKLIETELLRLSARRCCLCYGLHQDLEEKEGQIAHLDKDNSNNKIDNLAWLCLERVHHSYYDSKTSQHKNYTIQEVKSYRKDLYSIIEEKRIKISKTVLKSNNGENYYERFSTEYIGRVENVQYVLDFLNNPDQHFMLLYGVGGMGKSHLISECRKKFINPNLKQTECTSNYNLNSLFKTCGINYPEELSSEEKIKFFIDEFIKQNICLILDDFYETIDSEIREMLPKLASIPYGKILLVSRAIPKELNKIGFQYDRYLLPPLHESDFNKVIEDYVLWKEKNDPQSFKLSLTKIDLKKIYGKAQGYPLGGQLIVDLLFSMEKLDDILKAIPRFDAELDEEGKQFSGRLLDSIFKKGSQKEITLLCEFSALFGSSSKEVIKQLPSWKLPNSLNAFETLVNRRRFIYKDENGDFNSHAMIKAFAYDKLIDKPAVHKTIGKYFEKELLSLPSLNFNLLESAIQHYRRVESNELLFFAKQVYREFGIRINALIERNIKNAIRDYKSLIEKYPNRVLYYVELGIAYRLNNQKTLAIETLENAIKIDSQDIHSHIQLGITYRETRKPKLAIEWLLRADTISPNQVDVYNQLGIAYREIVNHQSSIGILLRGISIESNNLPCLNELGISYRENNQCEDAILMCEKYIRINPYQKQPYLNLLQIYLFFKPDKIMARKYFDILNIRPYFTAFSNRRKEFSLFIDKFDSIWNLSLADFRIYHKYIFQAIELKSYYSIIPLLFQLNTKYPNNLRIISWLGRSLSNQVIARNEEGRKYLRQAITLYKEVWLNESDETKKRNLRKQYEDHIFYFLYNLLSNEQKKTLQKEIENHQNDVRHLPKYHRFLARYFEFLEKSEADIISCYEAAINISETIEDKLKSFEALIYYLTTKYEGKYHQRIDGLKKQIEALRGKWPNS